MSIRDKQFNKVINTILKEELQKGNLPSSRDFIAKVNDYIQSHDLTRPSLAFTPLRRNAPANSDHFNEVLSRLYQDLDTLYVSVVDQNTNSLQHFNKFEVEKSKLEYQLKDLENQLKDIIMLYEGTGFLSSVYDVFVDLNSVDTAKTNANVDISNHEVRINDIKQTSKKVSPTALTRFDVFGNISPAPILESISGTTDDALSNKDNKIWQTRVTTTSNVVVPAYFHVIFTTPQEMNRIVLALETIKPMNIEVEISPEGINWFKLPYYEKAISVQDTYAFDFPMIKVHALRFKMVKNEPDNESSSINNEIRYSYMFGIKDISFYTYTYSLESDLYSTILDADPSSDTNFTINKVSLATEEQLPNGTDIKYYIALPPTSGEPEWRSISPVGRANPRYDQLIDFRNISTAIPNLLSIDPKISIGEYELENLYTHGIRFYKIGEINNRKIIDGSERLFVGKNTWGIKKFQYQHPDHSVHIPDMIDWKTPQGKVSVDYVKISDSKPGMIMNRVTNTAATNYMFTLGVFSDKVKDIATAIPASNDPITIYINGEMVFQGIPNANSKTNFPFQNGWNEIIVLVYTRQSMGTVNGATVDINFDPRAFGSKVYSQTKPLEKVSIFDLRYNVMNNDYSKYALIEANNKTQVVINNTVPGLEYEFYYDYIDGEIKDKILFKATLVRDGNITQASPKLKSYRLRFS